jgi:hypothetical protein
MRTRNREGGEEEEQRRGGGTEEEEAQNQSCTITNVICSFNV